MHLFIYDQRNNISEFMMALHGDYAKYYNRQTKRTGHVFGERFNNKIVQCNIYGTWLSRYIHRQAVDAGLVSHPKDYPWTSYQVYLGTKKSTFVQPDVILDQFGKGNGVKYEEFVIGDQEDPVDWHMRNFHVRTVADLINIACQELDIGLAVVMKPKGHSEQMMRSQVIIMLIKKYGIKAADTAKTFGLMRSTITRILQRANDKK